MSRRFYLYVKAFSDFGSMLDTIVLTGVLLTWTHSASIVSWSLAARTFGGLLSSLSSGNLADKWDRRRMMMTSDIVRALFLAILLFWPSARMIIVVCFVLGFVGSYFSVSFSASVPDLYGEDNLFATNARIARLSSISMVAGFLAAGVLTSWIGYQPVIGIDVLSYLFSAMALAKLRWSQVFNGTTAIGGGAKLGLGLMQNVSSILRYLQSQPLLSVTLVVVLVQTFAASAHNLGIPMLSASLSPTHQIFTYGLIWGVWGIGNVVATMGMPKLRFIERNPHNVFLLSSILMSVGFILFLSQHQLVRVLPLAWLTGIFDATTVTLAQMIMQRAEAHIRGRIFGVSTLLNRLGFGIGFLVAPMLYQATSLAHMVWILHGFAIVSCAFALVISAPMLRQLRKQSVQPALEG